MDAALQKADVSNLLSMNIILIFINAKELFFLQFMSKFNIFSGQMTNKIFKIQFINKHYKDMINKLKMFG